MTPLLLWRSASGVAMELRGRTVTHRASGYQWFKEVRHALTLTLTLTATNGSKRWRSREMEP